jgi:hypothetical protein
MKRQVLDRLDAPPIKNGRRKNVDELLIFRDEL